MYRVLLLDDEPNILSALRRCLQQGRSNDDETGIVLECFTSPEKALQRLEEQEFDLIISDYRMPDMNGVDFLSRAIELDPSAVRMLLSAQADREAMVAAINQAHVVHFAAKPWRDDELRRIVRSTLATRSGKPWNAADRRSSIAQRLEEETPGITHIDVDDLGGIVLEDSFGL